jgi:hypothetical protein
LKDQFVPCGADCVYIPDTNKCDSKCPSFYKRNATSGRCEAISCELRRPNVSLTDNLCGVGCVGINPDRCDYDCPVFYMANKSTKMCESIEHCERRSYTGSQKLKCGEGCVFNPEAEV